MSRYFRRLSVICYLFSTFINHAIRNTELRLILLSIACGQVAFRRSILSAHQILAWCMMYYPPRPSAFSNASLSVSRFSTMPQRRCGVMRFEINYSGGRRPRVGGRGPIFRSTAYAISITGTPREAASMAPQCGLDLRN